MRVINDQYVAPPLAGRRLAVRDQLQAYLLANTGKRAVPVATLKRDLAAGNLTDGDIHQAAADLNLQVLDE